LYELTYVIKSLVSKSEKGTHQAEDLFMRVWEHTNLYFSTTLHGKLLSPENSHQRDQGIMFGTQPISPGCKTSIMRLPKRPEERYCCLVHTNEKNVFFDTDAVLLTHPLQSVAFATSDCGATILYAKNTGDVILVHTGRNQLMAATRPSERVSIVQSCIELLYERGALSETIHSLSVSQIAAVNFSHRGHPDESVVRSQAALWGETILQDSVKATLDLVELIATQLTYYGIPKSNISRVRINPFTSPDLASKRAGKTGSNVIMVARPSIPTPP
jgi:copper oxidase (laccase) domain-containing protein